MKNFVVEGIVTALAPIFHGGDEKTGSTPVLRTVMIYTEKYGEVIVPYISGNSIRGKARRLIMAEFLRLVNFEITNSKLYHSLFSGGILESVGTTSYIDLELRKRIRGLLVPISLFGMAIGNQLIPGILIVEHMFPICEEYKEYLPDKYRDLAKMPVRVLTDQSFITRRDDLREERKDEEQAVQMKVDYECFVPGTRFYHRWVLQVPTELQISCLGRVIELYEENPYIGGRNATGDGKVKFDYINRPSSELYMQFIEENKEQIRELLKELEAMVK